VYSDVHAFLSCCSLLGSNVHSALPRTEPNNSTGVAQTLETALEQKKDDFIRENYLDQ